MNNRIAGLKQKGYDLEPEKQNGRNIYSADQIALMDRLDAHLKAGHPIATFPAVSQDSLPSSYRTQDISSEIAVSQDRLQLSHRTQDNRSDKMAGAASLIDAIAGKVVEIISLNQAGLVAPDPLANLRMLQEACDRGWLLSTSQLAPLLGVKGLNGRTIERFGFTFTRVGRNGIESAWKVGRC